MANSYLKEEIQAEALVRNLPGFVRFLPIAALFHGQTINVSSIARDAGVARTTVNGYLDINIWLTITIRHRNGHGWAGIGACGSRQYHIAPRMVSEFIQELKHFIRHRNLIPFYSRT